MVGKIDRREPLESSRGAELQEDREKAWTGNSEYSSMAE